VLEELLQQALQNYGPEGLLIAFLVLGPGFTYIRSRNTRLQMETKAQELLNQFLVEERKHGDQLESKLSVALVKLEAAKQEVVHLREQLVAMPVLSEGLMVIQARLDILEAGQEQIKKEVRALDDEEDEGVLGSVPETAE